MNYLVLWFVRLTGIVGYWLCFRSKYHYVNKKNNPRKIKGKKILIANHGTVLDFIPMFAFHYFKVVHVLVAEVMYRKKFLSWLLKSVGCIKVDRVTSDLTFMNESVNILNKGGTIGIFPEGRLIGKNCELAEFKPSVIYLALKTKAPIIPMYMSGNYGFLKPNHILIGEPIYIHDYCHSEYPTSDEIKQLSEMLRSKVNDLRIQLNEKLKK